MKAKIAWSSSITNDIFLVLALTFIRYKNMTMEMDSFEDSVEPDALSENHPLPIGARVRHAGRQWSLKPFATILGVEPGVRDTHEYSVAVDEDADFGPIGSRTSQWSSSHTYGSVREQSNYDLQ